MTKWPSRLWVHSKTVIGSTRRPARSRLLFTGPRTASRPKQWHYRALRQGAKGRSPAPSRAVWLGHWRPPQPGSSASAVTRRWYCHPECRRLGPLQAASTSMICRANAGYPSSYYQIPDQSSRPSSIPLRVSVTASASGHGQGRCNRRRGVGHADVVYRRVPLRRPRQLLP